MDENEQPQSADEQHQKKPPSALAQAADHVASTAPQDGLTQVLEMAVDGACAAGNACIEGAVAIVGGALDGL